MKKVLFKTVEIILILLMVSIPLGYIGSVIRTEILVQDKGLPLVMGFVFLPFMVGLTGFLCYQCVSSLTNIGGEVYSVRFGYREWTVADGIVCFIITLVPSLLFIWGSVYTFLEVTGLTRFGMFTY
ncbi:MAG: hypothetical protein J6T72_00015 [Alphaproteobacteria bacterium]|nr:hypothetical protein [Alphaproteobacteria bacterium]